MAEYTFTDSSRKQFTVSGPESLTESRAREIFETQSKTGALVGLSPGSVINSTTQALGGVTGAVSSAMGSVFPAAPAAVAGITRTLTSGILPTSPINLGNLAKSAQGVAAMAGLPATAVTAGLSSLQRLVNQPTSVLSNNNGLGCFGLNVSQLETAGYVKPGISARTAGSTIADVLKSPTVWTGKDGITSAGAMLKNPSIQNLTQQSLMSNGLNALKTVGIPVGSLNPQAAVGAALNAAKSVPAAAAWSKGAALPTDLKTSFDQVATSGAFGVNLSDLKANGAMLEEEKITGSANTVNRATLNAATQRILGDPKIPKLTYTE